MAVCLLLVGEEIERSGGLAIDNRDYVVSIINGHYLLVYMYMYVTFYAAFIVRIECT